MLHHKLYENFKLKKIRIQKKMKSLNKLNKKSNKIKMINLNGKKFLH